MKKEINYYLKIIDQIEKVRGKNNLNWMNILRLAFKNSPDDAKKIFKKINTSDQKINDLFKKLTK
tara:strand:- start:79 stop:273 length:195 start_codon:yes stop_codon:yes gene_type:complete